jgi:hypothetical protein
MNNYNPYAVYSNGGFQQFDGYCYSNITSSAAEGVPSQEPLQQLGEFPSVRPYRTLTTISTDSSFSVPSKNKTSKNARDQDQVIFKAPKKSQEPAYRFSPYAFDGSPQLSEEPLSTPKNWSHNPADFNLLVVPSSNAAKNSTVAINLRRPDGATKVPNGTSNSRYKIPIPNSDPNSKFRSHFQIWILIPILEIFQ